MRRLVVVAIAALLAFPAWSAVDEIAQERRAYRDTCAQYENYGWCECMGAGLAQALTPAEMRLARASLPERYESVTAETAAATAAAEAEAPQYLRENRLDSYARIREVETGLVEACMQFRDDGHDGPARVSGQPPRDAGS